LSAVPVGAATPLWLETDEGMAMSTMTETEQRVTAGVDTHRDVHVVAVLDERGGKLGCEPFAADAAGYRKALAWVRSFGPVDRIGVEGSGSYGAGLTRYLHNQRVAVVEVSCPNRQRRRSHGKSDPVDAVAAARAAQSGEASAQPKSRTGNVEAIRALRVVRRSAAHNRVDSINQMRALLVTGPEQLRESFRGTTVWRMVTAAARLRPGDPTTPAGATKFALRELAKRIQSLKEEIGRLDAILRPLVTTTAPALIARYGVGPGTAGTLLVSVGDNPERLHKESAFAHMCGSAPIDASSGLVVHKRLNRGGDRLANEALWHIVMVRMVSDPRTRHYVERRTKEGKSKREIMRCLKRYVARELYPYLVERRS
jgi:transposase